MKDWCREDKNLTGSSPTIRLFLIRNESLYKLYKIDSIPEGTLNYSCNARGARLEGGLHLFADFINGALCPDPFCRWLFIFQVHKNVMFNYRWCPFVPTLSIECKILAWKEKTCASVRRGIISKRSHLKLVQGVSSELVGSGAGFQESKRLGPPGNSRHCWGRWLSLGKGEGGCVTDLMCNMSQSHRWISHM